jgi:hypothetical protein
VPNTKNNSSPLSIGYSGYSSDFTAPGDRRRLCAYARARGHSIQSPRRGQAYDVIYLTTFSDLPYWLDYKRRSGGETKLVFEMIDSYLQSSNWAKKRFRGVMRFVSGAFRRPHFDFDRLIGEALSEADACVCATVEQEAIIREFNGNVHRILDIFDDDFASRLGPRPSPTDRTSNGSPSSRVRILWEGQPYTLPNILAIRSVLESFGDGVELRVLTDSTFYRFGKRYWEVKTTSILSDLRVPIAYVDWSPEALVHEAERSDLAIIPIDQSQPLDRGKPENKLILLLKLGIPVLVSPTPAYRRCAELLGIQRHLCDSPAEWTREINRIAGWGPEDHSTFSEAVASALEAHYSTDSTLERWDGLFRSIG